MTRQKRDKKGKGDSDRASHSKVGQNACENDTDEAWTCKFCKETFTQETDMLLVCERCDMPVCLGCTDGVTEREYNLLQNSRYHWFCNPCEESAMSAVKSDNLIEQKCNHFFQTFKTDFQQKIDQLQEQIDELKKAKSEEENKEEKDEPEQKQTTCKARDKVLVNSVSTTLNERIGRRKNVVIFGLKEPETNVKDETRQQDTQTLRDIYKTVTDTDIEPQIDFEVNRLGRKKEDEQAGNKGDSKRPLLVKFSEEKTKIRFMRNLSKLKNSQYTISVREDLSREDREKERELREEVSKKNSENEDPQWFYIVKGETWNRRIVRVRKKTEGKKTED
jgi:hypothetical protein